MGSTEDISDGYHTFKELYTHRLALTAALCNALPFNSWRSKRHHPDGQPMFEGYFIVGIDLPTGMVTYHYEIEYWDDFTGSRILDHAPPWDGATPDDSVERLLMWVRGERKGW